LAQAPAGPKLQSEGWSRLLFPASRRKPSSAGGIGVDGQFLRRLCRITKFGGTPNLTGQRPVPVRLRGSWDGAVEVRSCAVKNRAVLNRNCVAAMRGGEQRNENDRSVTQAVREDRRRELGSVGVSGRVCWQKTKPAKRAIGGELNRRATGRSPVNAPMVGDGRVGSPNDRNQGDPPGSSGVHGGNARRTARGESERP
jgi:hypothetical protein